MKRIVIAGLMATLVLGGCTVGGNISKIYTAQNPGGEEIGVRIRSRDYFEGEFLSLDERAITLLVKTASRPLEPHADRSLASPRVARISLDNVRTMKLYTLNSTPMSRGRKMESRKRDKVKLYSRYPQGIAPALMERLLAAYRQDSLIVIE